ncbi:MAG: hypothetical protein ACTS5A_03380, partial [Candidatus Hodgkinia cicadicola]
APSAVNQQSRSFNFTFAFVINQTASSSEAVSPFVNINRTPFAKSITFQIFSRFVFMLNLTQRSSITPHGRAILTSEGIAPLRWDCGALMPSVHGRVSV